jgi:hypothetical protein
MDYMSQSKLKVPLRRLLYKIKQNGRRNWADILATIAENSKDTFLASFTDGYTTRTGLPNIEDTQTILFEIAKHDTDPEIQCVCLESLNQLSKHCQLIFGLIFLKLETY